MRRLACCFAFLFIAPGLLRAQAPRIDPNGIYWTIVVSGKGLPPGAVEVFGDFARGPVKLPPGVPESPATLLKWPIVLVAANKDSKQLAAVRERLEKHRKDAPKIVELILDDTTLKQAKNERLLHNSAGIWLAFDDLDSLKKHFPGDLQRIVTLYLKREGLLGVTLPAAAVLSDAKLLPDSVIVSSDKRSSMFDTLKASPALVGYEIADDAALTVRGRLLRTVGPGKVTIHLSAADQRPARQIVLEGKGLEDLTALRRAARARSLPAFPVAQPPAPFVEKGTLIIVGGGGTPKGMNQRFVELAGGKDANIVILPIANPGANNEKVGLVEIFRNLGAKKVTALNATQRDEVESKEFLDTLREATGVWFGGGRQWRFVDAYEGTKAAPLFHEVLKRGGVIGGSSAGASIQGDYLCRGNPLGNLEIAFEGYERGLGFLAGVAIDQHFTQRKRHPDMTSLMKRYPQLLGIGIDESTAIVVQGSVAEVFGAGKAHFYDARRKTAPGAPDHEALGAGSRYDLKARMAK